MGLVNASEASEYYGVITYHTKNNLGDVDVYEQFFNPIFMLITVILVLFSSSMLALCTLLSCSCLRPQFTKCQKCTKKRCSFVI